MSRARAAQGIALVLVLVALSVTALLAIGLGLTAALDGLAARHVQAAARAEGQVEGALQMAAQQVASGLVARAGATLGPWPAAGIRATVAVRSPEDGAWRLEGRALDGASAVVRVLVLRVGADGTLRLVSRE